MASCEAHRERVESAGERKKRRRDRGRGLGVGLELQRGAFEREGLWARRSSTPLDRTGRRRLFADLEGIEGYSKELASWVRRGSGMIPMREWRRVRKKRELV